MSDTLAKWLVGVGLILIIAGAVVWLFGDRLGWLGHLPGDVRIENDNFGFYFPLTTMIIVSIILSILLSVVSRLFGK